jgi:SAM-dependent methyltransferase
MKSALARPVVYRLFHILLGTARMRRCYIEEFVRPLTGSTVVDIGCGPGDILEYLPEVRYVGVDYNPSYISYAKERWPQAEFLVGAVGMDLREMLPPADLVMANAILHHLSNDEAEDLFKVARSLIKPGGRFVTLDNYYRPGQHWLSKALIASDRGRFVRGAEEYARFGEGHFSSLRKWERADLLRVPYDIVMFEFSDSKGVDGF